MYKPSCRKVSNTVLLTRVRLCSSISEVPGSRVKKLTGSSTTIYIGKLYEVKGGNVTKFIFTGSTRIVSKTSTDTYYYHHQDQDHLGSTRVVTNSSGANVEQIHYYPYGKTLSDDGSVSVKHKFTSQELDRETGLYNYGARCYDPVLGRFTTADPIVPNPTNPQGLNRYSYVLNNPLKYTDPSGHGWFKRIRKEISRQWKKTKRIVKTVYKYGTKSWFEYAGINSQSSFSYSSGNGEGSSGYGGVFSLIARVATQYISYRYSDKGGGGSHASTMATGRLFTNKDGSQHVPKIALRYYGLEGGQPDKDGNYNSEEAVWKLLNAVNSTGGIKEKAPKNWDLIYKKATTGFEQGILAMTFLSLPSGKFKTKLKSNLYVILGFAIADAFISAKNEYDRQGSLLRVPGMRPPWEAPDPKWD